MALFLVFMYLSADLKDDASENNRRAIARFMARDRPLKYYRVWLRWGLNWLDARLSAHEAHLPPSHRARAFSFSLLNLALGVALAYPILALFLNWAVWNNGAIAGLVVIPAEENWRLRYAGLGAFFACIMLVLMSFRLQGAVRRVLQLVALLLAFAVAVAGAGAAIVAVEGAVAVTVAFAGAVAAIVAFAFAVAFAVAFAGAGAFAVAGAFASAIAVEMFGQTFRRPSSFLFGWAVCAIALIAVAVLLQTDLPLAPNGTDPAAVILFVGVLPLANGLTDFLSYGATRYFLRQSLRGRRVLFSLLDVITAVALFAALGVFLICFIHFVTPQNGQPLLSLPALFDTLSDPRARGAYWWLFVMMFSVIVPTGLHLALGLFVGLTHFARWLGRRQGHWLEGTPVEIKNARFWLSVFWAVSLTGSCWILIQIWTFRWWVAEGFIGFFAWFAESIGAIPGGLAL